MKKIKQLFLAISFISAIPTYSFAENPIEKKEKIDLIGKHIRDINMQMFPWEDDGWSAHSFKEYLTKFLKMKLEPTAKQKRGIAFSFINTKKIIEQHRKIEDIKSNDDINTPQEDITTWSNLNLFCAEGNKGNYIGSTISRTQTELGETLLYTTLAENTTDVELLKKRQDVIRLLQKNNTIHQQLDDAIKPLEDAERIVLAMWSKKDHFRHTAKRCYFSFPGMDKLNQNDYALFYRSWLEHGKRFSQNYFTILASASLSAYGIYHLFKPVQEDSKLHKYAEDYKGSPGYFFPKLWEYKNRWFHAALAIAGGICCGVEVKESLEWTRDMFFLEKVIQELTIRIASYIRVSKKIYMIVKEHEVLATFPEFQGLVKFFEDDVAQEEMLKDLMDLVENPTLEGDASYLSDKGIVLRAFDLAYKVKSKLENLVESTGKVDVYLSCAKLVKEFEHKQVRFCYANYETSDKPFVVAKGFWHPLIDTENVIPNNVTLGTNSFKPNMIITGPNAAGKSCILKALTISLIMAQTFGIVPAEEFTFTPFTSIATYLNITDDVDAGNSLFKSEVKRAQKLIDKIQTSQPHEFSFTVFDEIFNGTSPVEGTAAAYGVAKHLGGFENSVSLIATHFPLITKLEQDVNTFANYKVTVDKDEQGHISYPYKLVPGISNQHVALDILKNEGFEGSVIEEAQRIVQEQE